MNLNDIAVGMKVGFSHEGITYSGKVIDISDHPNSEGVMKTCATILGEEGQNWVIAPRRLLGLVIDNDTK